MSNEADKFFDFLIPPGDTSEAWRQFVDPKHTSYVDSWAGITQAPGGFSLQNYDDFFTETVNRTYPVNPDRKTVEDLGKGDLWVPYGEKQVLNTANTPPGENGLKTYYKDLNNFVGELIGVRGNLLPANNVGLGSAATPSQYETRTRGLVDVPPVFQVTENNIKSEGEYSDWHDPSWATNMREVLKVLYNESSLKQVKDTESDILKKAKEAAEKDPDNEDLAQAISFAEFNIRNNTPLSDDMLRNLENLGDQDFLARTLREDVQCVLRLNIGDYVEAHQIRRVTEAKTGDTIVTDWFGYDTPIADLPRYHPNIYLSYGDSTTLINKLAQCKHADTFLGIKTHEISQLVPMIRLFKCYYDTQGDLEHEVEINFGKALNQPRSGVGIKSFDWKLNASNPATIRNDIEVTLVLFFESFNELLKPLAGEDVITGEPHQFQYQELLLRPPVEATADTADTLSAPSSVACPGDGQTVYDPRFYEIKALVGWAPPPSLESSSENLLKAVKAQKLPLFLTLIDHEFSITQEGTFELSITYRARMEAIESDPRMDILTRPTSKIQIDKSMKKIEDLKKTCGSETLIEREQKLISKVIKEDHDKLSESIIRDLECKIYFTRMLKKNFRMGVKQGPEVAGLKVFKEDIINSIRARQGTWQKSVLKETLGRLQAVHPATDKEKEIEITQLEKGYLFLEPQPTRTGRRSRLARAPEAEVLIPWFYFGDLADAVVHRCFDVDTAREEDAPGAISSVELKNLIFLFSSFPIKVHNKDGWKRTIQANLADVPISLELFNQWYIENITRTNRPTYPILDFLRDFISDVVVGTLNKDCYDSREFREAWWQSNSLTQKVNAEMRATGQHMTQTSFTPTGRQRIPGDADLYFIPHLILKTAAVSLPSDSKSGKPDEQNRNDLGANPLEWLRTHIVEEYHLGKYASALIDTSLAEQYLDLTKRELSFAQTLKNSYHLNVFYLLNSDSYDNFGPQGTNMSKDPLLTPDAKADLPTREERDRNQGVFHLYLGADRGLVKSVSFSKVSAQYLRTARIQQDSLNPLAQLAATYNVDLKLIGNTIFWPGQYIFINPIGFGNGLGQPDSCESVSNQLGLGGYHLITEVNNFVESGKFETQVKALFEFSGDGRPSLPGATPTTSQCNTSVSSAGTSTTDVLTPAVGASPGGK